MGDSKSNSLERDRSPVRTKIAMLSAPLTITMASLLENTFLPSCILGLLDCEDAANLAATNRAWNTSFKQMFPEFIEKWLRASREVARVDTYTRAICLAQAFRMATDRLITAEQFVTLRDQLFTSDAILSWKLTKLAYRGPFLTSLAQGLVRVPDSMTLNQILQMESRSILKTLRELAPVRVYAHDYIPSTMEEIWRTRMAEVEIPPLIANLGTWVSPLPHVDNILTELAMQGCSMATLAIVRKQWVAPYDYTYDHFPEAAPSAIHAWHSCTQFNMTRVHEVWASGLVPDIYDRMMQDENVLKCAYNQPGFLLLTRFPKYISRSNFVKFCRSDFPRAELDLLGLDCLALALDSDLMWLPSSVWVWLAGKWNFQLPKEVASTWARCLLMSEPSDGNALSTHFSAAICCPLLRAGVLQSLLEGFLAGRTIGRHIYEAEWEIRVLKWFLHKARKHAPPAIWEEFVQHGWTSVFADVDYRTLVVDLYKDEMPPPSLLQYTSIDSNRSSPDISRYNEYLRQLAGITPMNTAPTIN